jgi:hypothetical protein
MWVHPRARQVLRSPATWAALALILLSTAAGLIAAGWLVRFADDEPAPARATGDPELPWFGFNELRWATTWQHGDGPDPDLKMRRSIEATAAAGANTDRLPVPWSDVVDAVGGWDEEAWSRYRDAYQEMVRDGIRPVIVLFAAPRGGLEGLNPNWSPPGCNSGRASPPDRTHDADWQAYVVRASNEFDRALALQVWNEPNSRDFWGGPECTPDPGRYLELVALARGVLSGPGSEHPDRALVSAGLSPATVLGAYPWDDFLEATIAGGLLDQVQAVGIHLYAQRRACGEGADAAVAVAAGVDRQLGTATALVAEPTPLWVTELGFSSAGGLTLDCRALTLSDQARAIAAAYDAVARSPRVDLAIVHQLVDEGVSFTDPFPNAFGVTRDEPRFLQPKPAYWCLAERRGVEVEPPPAC